jgi:hypothetical protein
MSREIPLEITHLHDRLRQDFTGILPEATSSALEERERNFLSRALAAFAIQRLSGCTVDEAAAAVVDGSGDSGIDSIHYAPASHRLWIVQSKFFADGQGEPSLGDVSKFRNGLEALLQGQFDVFHGNVALERKIPQLQGHFDDRSLEVRGVLVYSGIHLVSEDRIRLFEALRHRFSYDSDYFAFQHYNLTSVHDWLTGEHEEDRVNSVGITLYHPGQVSTPFETYYGLMSLIDVATLYTIHGKALIAANIRNYKGSTEVNDQILATIRDEPEHFFYLNNGLTAYCERLEVHNLDRADTQRKRLTVYGFSIVNGAQTVGSIAAFFASNPQPLSQGYVFLKIISLQRSPDERTFAQRITQSTNFQNQIGLRDFVALDEEQERIATHLDLSGILYHFKDSADTPSPDATNFTLEEATTALACLEYDPDCDFCARVLSNRSSLWSLEPVFPETAEIRSRYRRLFRPDRSARTVWRAVQARRAVVERMQENTRASTGKRKEFFENARWLVLHLIFLRYHPERGEELALSAGELDAIRQATDHVSEVLWAVAGSHGQYRHFKTIFCSAADCQRLKNTTMGRLAQVAPPAAPPIGDA